MLETHLVQVCDACFTASCWHGEFMCQQSEEAGIVELPISKLLELDREHPDNWSAAKMAEVYGDRSQRHLQALAAEAEGAHEVKP
jgi:hypothetical protein